MPFETDVQKFLWVCIEEIAWHPVDEHSISIKYVSVPRRHTFRLRLAVRVADENELGSLAGQFWRKGEFPCPQ